MSSNQHSAANGEGFPGKVTDSCKSWFFVIAFFSGAMGKWKGQLWCVYIWFM